MGLTTPPHNLHSSASDSRTHRFNSIRTPFHVFAATATCSTLRKMNLSRRIMWIQRPIYLKHIIIISNPCLRARKRCRDLQPKALRLAATLSRVSLSLPSQPVGTNDTEVVGRARIRGGQTSAMRDVEVPWSRRHRPVLHFKDDGFLLSRA
jgi:hypothetical protein